MIETAVDLGINYVDHATCYGDGEAETRFSSHMRNGTDCIYLQENFYHKSMRMEL